MALAVYSEKTCETGYCICQIPFYRLRRWIHLRFRENRSTSELMLTARTEAERKEISAVALLDVEDKILSSMLGRASGTGERLSQNFLECRRNTLQQLRLQSNVG